MSKKESKFFPYYQLHYSGDPMGSKELLFKFDERIFFKTKLPLFGATETQKVAMNWAEGSSLPPVICIRHGAVTKADKDYFVDPNELHYHYNPYAMVIATVECLGEKVSRKIKIYFCDTELYEDNPRQKTHVKSKGTYIIPITE